MQMTGNTVLITGGTSGIGRALAEAFHQQGNQVIIAGRRQALLDEVTAGHPGMRGIRVDVRDLPAVEAFTRQVREQFPRLNVLINNAGIAQGPEDLAGAFDLSIASAVIQTNVIGVLNVTAGLLPLLLEQPAATVATTSSGLAFMPRVSFPTYSASKAFQHSWLQSLRVQLAKTSVEVLELVVPYVQTELMGESQASDPHAMPLADYITELMHMLGAPVPSNGEIVSQRAQALRCAERNGEYDRMFAARVAALDTQFAEAPERR